MRWYCTPVEEDIPPEEYLARAERFHGVAEDLPPLIAARFEAMAADALDIASRKAVERMQ